MDHTIVVSIGIPVYNAEKHLKAAIDSVLNQTYQEFELILIDDGSTDSSLEIIKSYSDRRIVLVAHTKNKGIGFRLNEQIQQAKGKYFVRMDADDLMFPDRILQQIQYLENNTSIDVVGALAIVIDSKNQIKGLRKPKPVTKVSDILGVGCFIHPTVMGKTSWFQKHLYHPAFNGTEDHELFLRSFPLSQFSNLDFPVLFYRENNPISLNTYINRQKELIQGIRLNQEIIGSKPAFHWSILKVVVKCCLVQLLALFKLDFLLLKHRNQFLTQSEKNEFELILHKTN